MDGKESDLFEFLSALEIRRKKSALRVKEEEVGDEGERIRNHGG